MFNEQKKVTYVDIRSRIMGLNGSWLVFKTPDHLKEYLKFFKGKSINRYLADQTKNHAEIASITSFLEANKYNESLRKMLDKIIGNCINDEEELITFCRGLAVNGVPYGKKAIDEIHQFYMKNPEFIVIRLIETVGVVKPS